MKKLSYGLMAFSIFLLCCKQLYLPYEKPDFSRITGAAQEGNKIRRFYGPDAAIYKMYYVETEGNEDGVKFRSYGPMPKNKVDTNKIDRVATLIFLDDRRVLYVTSHYDWPQIEQNKRVVHLDNNYYRIKESLKKKGKRLCSYFRGYYSVEGNVLTVELDEGASVSRHKAPRFDVARAQYDNNAEKKADYNKALKKSEIVWMQFSIVDTAYTTLKLVSLEYFTDNLGINFDRPVEKTMNKIFSEDLVFVYQRNDTCEIKLMCQGKVLDSITCQSDQRTYHFRDGSGLSEPEKTHKDIITW